MRFFGAKIRSYSYLAKSYTFYRDQDPSREGHCLGGAACGRVLGEELAVDLIQYGKIISLDHEDGCLDDFAHAAACVFQDGPDVLEGCSGLVFKAIANYLSCIGVEAGGTGQKNEFFGDDGLGKDLAHTRGLRGIEIFSCFHGGIFDVK